MPLSALAILICAATIHAGAHVAFKRANDKLAFAWWQLMAMLVIYSPVLLIARWDWPPQVWLIVVVSGLAEAAYFYTTGTLQEILPTETRDALKGPAQVRVNTGFALLSQRFLCFNHRRECSRSRGLYF